MKKAIPAVILAFSLSLILAGCGYTTRSLIADKYRTIYIAPFVNKIQLTLASDSNNKYKIYRPLLETELTRGVINRFLADGNVKPVSQDSADLVLKGDLIEFRKDPMRYTSNDDVQEYRVVVLVNMVLWDKKNDKQVWEENGFTGDSSYFVTGPQSKSEAQAISDAITDISRRIVERVVEQW